MALPNDRLDAETDEWEPPRYEPGSISDFDRLYRDSYGKVLSTLVGVLGGDRALAEDCAQEAFVRAFKQWPAWRPEAPAEAWLMRIAINQAISVRRGQRIREAGELVRRLGRPAPPPNPEDLVSRPVVEALRRLPVADAALVVLRHHHGYSNREISAALGLPESTVSSRLVSAKIRLRLMLAEHQVRPRVVNPGSTRVVRAESGKNNG